MVIHGPAVWRQTLMKLAKLSQVQIARDLQESESTVSRVLKDTYTCVGPTGQATRDRVRAYIARKLGQRVEVLWPEPAEKPKRKRKG